MINQKKQELKEEINSLMYNPKFTDKQATSVLFYMKGYTSNFTEIGKDFAEIILERIKAELNYIPK